VFENLFQLKTNNRKAGMKANGDFIAQCLPEKNSSNSSRGK